LIPPDHNRRAHDRECIFYKHFAALEGLKIPRIYSIQEFTSEEDKEGHILMEYLGESLVRFCYGLCFLDFFRI
jgi:hypothetical protein